MGWILVFTAAAFEIFGVIGLKKYSCSKSWKYILHFTAGFAVSFALLYLSFRYISVSTAYAVWIGTGTAGAVAINMIFFGESKSMARIISLIVIIIGVVGLKSIS
ncbi:paired small multidrug resistance pump [Parelusimicrobium proximum]|uniref:DMT family transporter n=1 Tax=Parelusimicrobium proximum TaxID=3228953 RepID=UPI003D16AC3D